MLLRWQEEEEEEEDREDMRRNIAHLNVYLYGMKGSLKAMS